MTHKIINGNNIDVLKTYSDNTFDSIVTDPPYGIEFLGKEWDKHTGELETWQECLRVLKPGGYLLAFSAARTYHNLASNIEMAGFEIRDQLMWLYSSGFPKAQDIGKAIDKRAGKKDKNYGSSEGKGGEVFEQFNHPLCNKCGKGISYEAKCKDQDCGMRYRYQTPEAKQWAGWKTALKPAHEPIVMARKPYKGSTIDNVLKHGTGALNIDETRIGDEVITSWQCKTSNSYTTNEHNVKVDKGLDKCKTDQSKGRYPSNVMGEVEGYQKYFYCPKVSRKERHIGFDLDKVPTGDNFGDGLSTSIDIMKKAKSNNPGNNHPTVKPVELMSYLLKLVTPPGGHVLDPFNGSGSTGLAAVDNDFDYTGIELDPNYAEISRKRIEAWIAYVDEVEPANNFKELFD